MLVLLLGGVWSPSCSNFALKKRAEDFANAYDFSDEVVFTVKRNFYVDDLLNSLRTSQDAIKMQRELSMMLLQGGFHLTKWVSTEKKC